MEESDITGDEQEDLPYDGILECYLTATVNQDDISNSGGDIGGHQNAINLEEDKEAFSPNDAECVKEELLFPSENVDAFNFSERTISCGSLDGSELPLSSKGNSKSLESQSTIIPDVLLRHFNEDSLINQCDFIDYETIPELSLGESISKISFLDYNPQSEQSEDQEKYFLVSDNIKSFNDTHECLSIELSVDASIQDPNGGIHLGPSAEDISVKQLQPTETDITNKGDRFHERRHSFEDIKYGQGKVHYRLPDFSEIPPKVKIPKGKGSCRSVPTLHRSRSSPSVIGLSAVVGEILDSMQSFNEPGNIKETGGALELLGQTSTLLIQQDSPCGYSTINELDIQQPESDHNTFPGDLSIQLKDSCNSKESDTTSDEQEDLPYDRILECYLTPNVNQDDISNSGEDVGGLQNVMNLDEYEEAHSSNSAKCAEDKLLIPSENTDTNFSQQTTTCGTFDGSELLLSGKGNSKSLALQSTIIPEVLQRHLNEDSLFKQCDFIDYETIPELSLAESIDETVISKISLLDYYNDYSESEPSEDQEKCFMDRENKESFNSQDEHISNQEHLVDVDFQERDGETNIGPSAESMEIKELHPTEIDLANQEDTYQERRHSSYDIKYGQGQVHYKLPDFSKIPPKVKIPKGKGSSRSVPTLHRSRSSPSMIKSSTVVRELLDTMQPFNNPGNITETINGQVSQPLVCELEFKTKPQQLTSVLPLSFIETSGQQLKLQSYRKGPTQEFMSEILFQADNLAHEEECARAASFQLPTEGEKMADMLQKEAQQLQAKVEKLSNTIVKESLPLKEQCLVFQNLKDSVEALELDYLSKKEKHRQMQLQTCRTGSQTIGEFDLEREVEGQIFRLEMLLENIQEQLDANTANVPTESSANSYATAISSISKQTHRNSETSMDMVDLRFKEQTMNQSSDKVIGRKSPVTLALNNIQSGCVHLNAQGVSTEHRSAKSDQQKSVSKPRLYSKQCPAALNRYLKAETAIKGKTRSSCRRNGSSVTEETDTAENSLPECDDIEDSFSSEDSLSSDWILSHSWVSESRSYIKCTKKNNIPQESHKKKARIPKTQEYEESYGKFLGKPKANKPKKIMSVYRGNLRVPTSGFSRFSGRASSHQITQTAVCADERNLDIIDCKILNFALDKAIRTARNMQRTTERMVTSLGAGLATGNSSWRSDSHW